MTSETALDWAVIDRRARSLDLVGVASLVLGASEQERAAFARVLERGIKGEPLDHWFRGGSYPGAGYALAVIGTQPTAAKATALMTHRNVREAWARIPIDQFLEIARARELSWIGDLGARLAAKIPRRDASSMEWKFVAALLTESGMTPQVTEGVVSAWFEEMVRGGDTPREWVPMLDLLRADTYLDLLLPWVFTIDGFGAQLGGGSVSDGVWDRTPQFPTAVARLVDEGRLDRRTILDATVDRLVRGDRPSALRPFTMLHDELVPSVDELAGHAADYARLLAEGPGPVAGLGQRALQALDEEGRLDLDLLLEASGSALARKEKALVKTQLSWLGKVADRAPGRVAETIAVAFEQPSLELQDRALTLIGALIQRLDADTLDRITERATILEGDVAAHAAKIFTGTTPAAAGPLSGKAAAAGDLGVAGVGGSAPAFGSSVLPVASAAADPVAFVAVDEFDLQPPLPAALMPPPIATPAELGAEVVVLIAEQTAVRWERVLAGLVALHGQDLGPVLRPILERYHYLSEPGTWGVPQSLLFLGVALRAAIDPGGRGRTTSADLAKTAESARNRRVRGIGKVLAIAGIGRIRRALRYPHRRGRDGRGSRPSRDADTAGRQPRRR